MLRKLLVCLSLRELACKDICEKRSLEPGAVGKSETLRDGNCEFEIGAPMSGRAGLVINAKSWYFVKNSEEN